MKRLYRRRRDKLINCLKAHFSDQLRVLGDATGLHLVAEFHGVEFTEPMVEAMERAGVRIYPVESHAIQKGRHCNKLVMGYANLTAAAIEEGIGRIAPFVMRQRGKTM